MKSKRTRERAVRFLRTTVADANHVVHSIQGGMGDYCRNPCAQCPWRVDQTGSFPAEAFRISANTAHDMSLRTFACHMRGTDTPAACAGFLLNGAADNLAVRVKRIKGKMRDVSANGYRLHKSYRAMAVANGVAPNDPTLADCMPEARTRRDRERRTRTRRPQNSLAAKTKTV